jgi:ubiquinone/menaquinone biosynthesis C-methylase UbiE
MADTAESTARLTKFYGDLSPSLESILSILLTAGIDTDHLQASDLYERDLDCHNLGMHTMLGVLVGVVADHGAPGPDDRVLDLGCGLGGPGRFLVDRFQCAVIGVDLLPLRVELAQALTNLTGMAERISYRVADATDLGIDSEAFEQAWMLDVSMHIKDKAALFAEIARVLRPGGMLVMHEQTGPLPKAMRPVTSQAPYIAPSLPQLIRYVEGAGLRVLTWRDTTQQVLEHFQGLRATLGDALVMASDDPLEATPDIAYAALTGYIETLETPAGRTGILIARRVAC